MKIQYIFCIYATLYLVSTVFFFAYLFTVREKLGQAGRWLLETGLVFNLAYIILRAVQNGVFPVTSMHEALVFFSLLSGGLFAFFYRRFKILMAGVFVAPFILILTIVASFMSNETHAVMPVLQSFWLPVHVSTIFIGNAFFALSFVVSILYLIENTRLKKKRFDVLGRVLPSLNTLDSINHICLVYGFPFLTFGLITGAAWAQYAIGSYFNWDPKEIWSIITWLLYAALLHMRLITGWKGRRVALFSVLAFAILIFTFLGVTFLFKGYHTFKTP